MKAEIRKDGILQIAAETELESYALTEWLKNNFNVLKIVTQFADLKNDNGTTSGTIEIKGIYNISNILINANL